MISDIDFLDRVEIAAPCNADWQQMRGDDRKRYCDQCRLHVYNISDMSRGAAEALLRDGERSGRHVCIRLYRRADGTILTDNCPVGLRRLRNLMLQKWAVAASLTASLLPLPHSASGQSRTRPHLAGRVSLNLKEDPMRWAAGGPRIRVGEQRIFAAPDAPDQTPKPKRSKPGTAVRPAKPAPRQSASAHSGPFWYLVGLINGWMGGK